MSEPDYTIVRFDKKRHMGLMIGKDGKLYWLASEDSVEEALPEDYELKWDFPGLTKEHAARLREKIKTRVV